MWWMYQHTIVSAALACGVHVAIRSHVQALWQLFDTHSRTNPRHYAPVPRSSGRAIATSPSLGREGSAVAPYHAPARAPAAGRPAARPSSSSRSDQQNQPPARHDNNPTDLGIATYIRARSAAVQNGQRGQRLSAMADPTLNATTAVCTHCKARHWECERSKSTGHFSTCCSQGKMRLPPPPQPNPEYRNLLEGSNSGQLHQAKAFRENGRSYNNALSFTSLAAHWDQTQVGTLGSPVFRVFVRLYHRLDALIPAATDPRLGRDGADSRIQRSTLTKFESILRTGNRFVREFASAKARVGWDTAKEWILRLCLPPGRDRRTHNLPTSSTEMAMLICDSDTNTGDCGPQDLILQVHGDRCPDGRPKYQIVSSLHPSAMPLRYPLLFPAGEDGSSTPTFLFAGSTKPGHQSLETESRSTMVSNCARYLPVSVWMTKTKRRTITRSSMSVDRIKVLLPSRDPADDDDDLPAVDRTAAATTVTPNPVLRSVLRAMNGE
ncbi:BZ3500_MvSof-1268-A1-R1_Chr11-1g03292 [Microbotryum saponariae]|uniref:BZ3500_MvSof-1268-A1-R1_Chr11-1g03292 protein n=1 Tax=Microbotryum saponariae TaxID=289078 RepID=A0A2X0LUV8_9BASI|nr:BZ3501_MvSof-1269-A2-R1_Chr11g02867 [Microbotryum saponariae]SDA03899.1 BZ3500_MvSof-1268-A1-R1_Chr11-1g03292 [Microbotryum saponariae]